MGSSRAETFRYRRSGRLGVAPTVRLGFNVAIEPSWVQQVRADPHLLADMAYAVRGPFHVLYPAYFAENLTEFKDALVGAGVDGQVYFGKKANKAACWLSICAIASAGVDVGSAPELVHALGRGVRGEDVVVTGAAKSEELLWLAARHRCLIAVDALDELERVIATARSNMTVRILLRVLPDINPHSRFGLRVTELDRALERCVAERGCVIMEGFSFHLNGYEVAPLSLHFLRSCAVTSSSHRCSPFRAGRPMP
jgi:diaminopimelate decarboxylase